MPGQPSPLMEYQGRIQPRSAWAKELGLTSATIKARQKRLPALTMEEILSPTSRYLTVSKKITYRGESHTYAEWGAKFGYSANGMYARLNSMTKTEALKPKRKHRIDTVEITDAEGTTRTLREWSGHTGVPAPQLLVRYRKGLSSEDILRPEIEGRLGVAVITYDGSTMCRTEWAYRFGITYARLTSRLANGYTMAQIEAEFETT